MSRIRLVLIGSLTLLFAIAGQQLASARDQAYVHDQVREQLREKGEADVFVSLWDPKLPESRAKNWRQRVGAIKGMTRRFLAAAPGFKVRHTYVTQWLVAGKVDQEALDQLLASPLVEEVFVNRPVKPTLDKAGPLLGQPEAEAEGFDGHLTSIAIIDTGVDWTSPDLGGTPSSTFPTYKVIGGLNIIDNSLPPFDDIGHGTHVAGIAAGMDGKYRGIAPEATIVSYKVFDAAGGGGTFADITSAIDQAITDKDAGLYNIKVMNLSLGVSLEFPSHEACDAEPDSTAFFDAVADGIEVVVSSGNDGFLEGISYPGCISVVTSVGATYKESYSTTQDWGDCRDVNPPVDTPVCWSNRGELIDLYAPGANIISAKAAVVAQDPADPPGFISESGTSMSAPMVAGAAACVVNMLVADPWQYTDPALIKQLLKRNGVQVYDPATHVATPRVDVYAVRHPETQGPDLIVTSISTTATHPYPGDVIPLTLSLVNVGNQPSTPCTTLVVASENLTISPQDHLIAAVPTPALAPGESYTPLGLTGTAPGAPAQYYYVGAFADGEYVVKELDETNNSALGSRCLLGSASRVVESTIPEEMIAGQTYLLHVVMANEGVVPWTTAGGYELAAVSPLDTTRWGVSRVALPASVPPSGQIGFIFYVTAPTKGGWYPCHWQMVQGGHAFGEVATGALKMLVVDTIGGPFSAGQDFPAISGNRAVFEDYAWLPRDPMGPYGFPAITVSDLPETADIAPTLFTMPWQLPIPIDPYSGLWVEPYTNMDIGYHWYPAVSGDWVVWQVDDLYDPGNFAQWYFQVVAMDMSRPGFLPRRLTYNPNRPWDNWMPAVDGSMVVWEDYRNDDNRRVGDGLMDRDQIWIADANGPILGPDFTVASWPLTTADSLKLNPRISGNLVVWDDWRDHVQPDIFLYDLSVDTDYNGIPNWKEPPGVRPNPDPAEIRLTDTSYPEMQPDVSGRKVVWLDLRRDDGTGSTIDVYGLDLDTWTETPVATDPPAVRSQPRIDGPNVVWADKRLDQWDVYWQNLTTGATAAVAGMNVDEDVPDISGRWLVYSQVLLDLFGYQLRTVYSQHALTDTLVAVHTFADVAADYWAWKAIEAVVEHGIVTGYSDGTYRPEVIVGRDQMAVFIARLISGSDAGVPAGPATPTFTDVPIDYWAYKHIELCAKQPSPGVVTGYTDGTYRPTQKVNRGAMAVFVARAVVGGDANVPLGPAQPSFADVLTNFWAYKYIEYLKTRNVVHGYSDGLYHPEFDVTRAQMAVFIARAAGFTSD